MATNNSSDQQYVNNADGFALGGGTTARTLTVTGANMTLTGSGTNVFTFPAATDTLVGRTSTDTMTNKTMTTPVIGTSETIVGTSGTLEILANTDGGDFNIFHTVGTTLTLALYGSAAGIMNLNLLDGSLSTNSILRLSNAGTLQNTRINKLSATTSGPGATPTINTDTTAYVDFTAVGAAITSMTTNLSGTPVRGDTLWISFTDNGTARGITWGTSYEASTVALPTTTVISTRLDVGFVWNVVSSKWRCVGVA